MSAYSYGDSGAEWRERSSDRIVLFPFVALILIAGLSAATVYLFLDLRDLRADVSSQLRVYREEVKKLEASVKGAAKGVESKVQELHGAVATARTRIDQSASEVEKKAVSRAERVAQEVAEKLESKQRAAISVVGSEVQELKKAASQASTRLGSLTGEVSEVRKAVGQTQSALEAVAATLKSVRGDLGVQSGLIATNTRELEALRYLGQRSYIEFRLPKTAQPQQVGDTRIKLRRADPKRNTFTLELWVDDRRIEKKDRAINEPIQFYVVPNRVPHELVVNRVQKDLVVGYLSAPKSSERAAQ